MIAVLDYGMGNLRSVLNALEAIGAESFLAPSPAAVGDADRLILPGVGAFGDGMKNLRERGFVEAMPDLLDAGRPLLGICLGMQLLASVSEEHGEHEGLGLVPGAVRRLETDRGLRVPHVGWNVVRPRGKSVLLTSGDDEQNFYFVHSYHLLAEERDVITGIADYGIEVTAVVERGNVMATQFHPEKSQRDGLALLRRFVGC